MPKHAIMFDLDGTLADTLRDIAHAGNFAMRRLGLGEFPTDAYRAMVGSGARVLIERALAAHQQPADEESVRLGVHHFKDHYTRHGLTHTAPYAGIGQLLDALAARGAVMAILSNKPHPLTQQVVGQVLGRWEFAAIEGARKDRPLKPAPDAALQIAGAQNIAPEDWLYVGDTGIDIQTAQAAGMPAVAVTWGFRDRAQLIEHGPDFVVDRPDELLEILEAPRARGQGPRADRLDRLH